MKKEDYWHKVKITGWKNFFHQIPVGTKGYIIGHWSGYVYNVKVKNVEMLQKISCLDFKVI